MEITIKKCSKCPYFGGVSYVHPTSFLHKSGTAFGYYVKCRKNNDQRIMIENANGEENEVAWNYQALQRFIYFNSHRIVLCPQKVRRDPTQEVKEQAGLF